MDKATAIDIGEPCDSPQMYRVSRDTPVPGYLEETYWWAYVNPKAVRLFERQWLVNLILWGNFARLRDWALDEVGDSIGGRSLQIACVYGDFTQRFAGRLAPDAGLDLVDVVPAQLENASHKISGYPNVNLYHQDSTSLGFADATYDNVVVFFLLHEQPDQVRRQTIREALRTTRTGGKVIFLDYHKPSPLNPFRLIMRGILGLLEPFALDMWEEEISAWVPAELVPAKIHKEVLFGGLYQKVVMVR